MRKLVRKGFRETSIEAYGCVCGSRCSAACPCGCSTIPYNTQDLHILGSQDKVEEDRQDELTASNYRK